MRFEKINSKALRIGLIYLVIGLLYILFSDRIVNEISQDADYILRIQTYKGFVFIVITSVIIYLLVYQELLKQRKAKNELLEQNARYEALNEQLRQINTEVVLAKEKAEESDKLKTAFLQNLSHEIRTPLNAITGFTELLMDDNMPMDKRKRFAEIIMKSSQQLLSIVSDVITMSSIETGQVRLNISNVNLNHIISGLSEVFSEQAAGKRIRLIAKKGLNDHDAMVSTDGGKITHILSSLISNALKFTIEGYVEFGYMKKENELEFFVRDSGIGIDKDMFDKIFEYFRQVDISSTRTYGGTGLGLSIARGLVGILSGKMQIESEPGKGSAFWFSVPYNPVEVSSHSHTEKFLTGKNFTLLVVEDEYFNSLLFDEMLANTGIKVVHAGDGREAVEVCRNDSSIDIVLMDIKLPIMDGYTAAGIIRKERPGLPIIAQTAYALESEIKKFQGVFDGYITKPIHEPELNELLSIHMNLH
ncbi:MAG: response regulator [Bacteroidetes bacterium]|nr:response regulator [Bacteroidota bacterium]